MDKSQFADALEKGHGRAMQHTLQVGSLVDEELAMRACLENLACDWQLEGPRALWMVGMLDAGHALPRLAQPLLARVLQPSEQDDEQDLRNRRPRGHLRDQRGRLSGPPSAQRAELVLAFARRGYEGSREVLDALLGKVDTPSDICEGLARLDGEQGVIHAATMLGRLEDESLDIGAEVLHAFDRALGDGRALRILQRNALTNPDVRWLLRAYKRERKGVARRRRRRKVRASFRPRNGREAVRHLVRDWGHPAWFYRWCERAASTDLAYVFHCAKEEPHLPTLRQLVRGLACADHQEAVPWLLTLTRDDNPMRARMAQSSVAYFTGSQETRDFIEQWLREGGNVRAVMLMLAANYRPGDATSLIDRISELRREELCAGDRCGETYWCYHDLMDVYEADPEDAASIPMYVYEQASCAYARYKAVAAMSDARTLSEEIARECLYDSYDDTRQLVQWLGA